MDGRVRVRAAVAAGLLCSALVGCDVLPRHPENGLDNPIDVMVVGDSFTAGNNATLDGNDGYFNSDKSTDDPRPIEQVRRREVTPDGGLDPDRGCYRNHNNYGETLYRLLQSTGAFINAACSGDITDNVLGVNGQPPQLEGFTQEQRNEVDLIALTIGGNDLRFKDVVEQCFVELTNSAVGCRDALAFANSQLVPDASGISPIQHKVSNVLSTLAEDWPNARIALVGYPLFYEDRDFTLSSGDGSVQIQPGRVLEDGLNTLNDQQASLVIGLNSTYVGRFAFLQLHTRDNLGFYDGHGVGGPEEDWIRSVGTSAYRHEWMHPSGPGHAAIANALNDLPLVQHFRRDAIQQDYGAIERASIAASGMQASETSVEPSVSADGRYVAFTSHATNLVPGDTNEMADVFVRDLASGTTELVSEAHNGGPADYWSVDASISADGRYVAFSSLALNLVTVFPDDWGWGPARVYVRDLQTDTTELVSVTLDSDTPQGDSSAPSISGDGRYVAFLSNEEFIAPEGGYANCPTPRYRCDNVFVRDRQTGTTELVSVSSGGTQANYYSHAPDISDDGRYVAYHTTASNLVPGGKGSNCFFMTTCTVLVRRDRVERRTERVSFTSDGNVPDRHGSTARPSISADGRYVAFDSRATNLVSGDTNGVGDIFVRDMEMDTTQRVSVGPGGAQANEVSWVPAISSDGRYVIALSFASNLVPDDTNAEIDAFVFDYAAGTARRVSTGVAGGGGVAGDYPAISAQGEAALFASDAPDLVPGDTNERIDVFVRHISTD